MDCGAPGIMRLQLEGDSLRLPEVPRSRSDPNGHCMLLAAGGSSILPQAPCRFLDFIAPFLPQALWRLLDLTRSS